MAKKKHVLSNEDLEKVSGGRKHTHHIETRAILRRLFNRNAGGDAALLCENPKHRQKQG